MMNRKMRVATVLLVLSCSSLAADSSDGPLDLLLPPSSPSSPLLPPSSRHYHHVDAASGRLLSCHKCPAGTFVSLHCSPGGAVRECSPCPPGAFTRGETGVERCHACRAPCGRGEEERAPCGPAGDRRCACPPGSFGSPCRPYTPCPAGSGVRRPGAAGDTRCKACPRGAFSPAPSLLLGCRAHTRCGARRLVAPGNRTADNACGPPPAANSSSSSSSSSSSRTAFQASIRPGALNSSTSSSTSSTSSSSTSSSSTSSTTSAEVRDPDSQSAARLLHLVQTTPPSDPPPRPTLPTPRVEVEVEVTGAGGWYRWTPRRGSPRPSVGGGFDINEHLAWMVVLLLLGGLGAVVGCSVRRSARTLKKGPPPDPASILERSHVRKAPAAAPSPPRERWVYPINGHGVDLLRLVSSQLGAQWVAVFQSLAGASEGEVGAICRGHASEGERAQAALSHWALRHPDASLAALIHTLQQHQLTELLDKIRYVMEHHHPGVEAGKAPEFDANQLMPSSVNMSQSPVHKHLPPLPSPASNGGGGVARGFFPDESEPLLRCDSTSSKDSALSRTGSFITKERKDTVLRQVRLDPCDLQPVFDDMLHILNPQELQVIEEIPAAEDKLDRLFEIAGTKSQEASQTLLDSVYSHLPDLL